MTRATLLSLTKPTSAPAAQTRSVPAESVVVADSDSGFVAVDASAPQVNLMDLGLTRGDGVFETISVVDGHPQALEPHLQRLAHSAALLDLPEPELDVWRRAVLAGVERYRLENDSQLEKGTARELYAKLILTRGVEGTREPPSGWVFVDMEAEDFSAALSGHPRRHPRPRLPPRRRRDLPVASAGREDPVVRGESRGPPRGRPPGGERRGLRQLRRLRPGGSDLQCDRSERQHRAHPADRPGHPGRHHPGQRVRVLRAAGDSRPPTSASPPTSFAAPTPSGLSPVSARQLRSPTSTVSPSTWMRLSPTTSTPSSSPARSERRRKGHGRTRLQRPAAERRRLDGPTERG